ncbi:MAG: tyrosine-type recombinase/integrase [Candidatus Saccharimonas sp.]
MNPVLLSKYDVIEPLTNTFNWLLMHMDVSAATIADYSGRLNTFLQFLLANGIDGDTLIRYKKILAADTSLKASTKNKKLTVARIFLRELYRRGYIPRDITLGIKGFQQSNKHKVSGLDDDDMQLLREWVSLNQYRTPVTIRLTAMLLLLTYQGLRQIELTRLEFEDIDFVGNRIFIHGKGRDDKEPIHLSPDVAQALRRYCDTYQISSGYVFFSISNNRSKGSPLTTRGLRATVTKLFNKLGIDRNVHGLRHYYVTKLIREFPGELFMVRNFTRHRSLEQLAIYNDAILQAKDYPKHDLVFSKVLL